MNVLVPMRKNFDLNLVKYQATRQILQNQISFSDIFRVQNPKESEILTIQPVKKLLKKCMFIKTCKDFYVLSLTALEHD